MLKMVHERNGFALPTILIASVVMLIVLITTVSATTSIRTGLDNQYYTELAREAAESGLARANSCLSANSYIPQWTTASPLHANTSCTGGPGCTNSSTCFVMMNNGVRTSFIVNAATSQGASQTITATGTVELTRTTSGDVWKTYTYTATGRIGVSLSVSAVAFGYTGGGAFFSTITSDGLVRSVGYNGNGQLGNGTTTNVLTPTPFQLNGTDRAAGLYTNFVSGGFELFAITNQGALWGAGANSHGELGDGTTTDRSIPVRFMLPAGKIAKNVALSGGATFVTTTDNYVYASGNCSNGVLGYNYTISGCSNQSSYVTVALPTPSSDPNTQPVQWANDRASIFTRMAGGKVYGWGINDRGQFGNGTTTSSSLPLQIGTYGNSGQPKAVSIAFDGDTLWVVDDSGAIKATGKNSYGQLAGNGVPIYLGSAGKCIENQNGDGITVRFYTCLKQGNQQWTFRPDGSIYNAATNKCLDNYHGDGTHMQLYSCNGTGPQTYIYEDDNTIYNPYSGNCLNNSGYDNVTLILWTCGNYANEHFSLPDVSSFVTLALPSGSGNAVKVTTDQWFPTILTSTGQVWSAGLNDRGQLGNGTTSVHQPYPVQFSLPYGVTAVDIATCSLGTGNSYANTFVVGSDGMVYGAGANTYGQIGDGTTWDDWIPTAMNVIDGVSIRAQKVQCGLGTAIVFTTNQKVYTVGNNANGQLGDGTTTNSSTPRANIYTNVLPLTQY